MKLSDLRPTAGSKKRPKRLGRGNASGHGTSATRGGKGQTARTGYRLPPAFEGGQTPLWKRTPKRGFKNALRRNYAPINVGQLHERFSDGTEVTLLLLAEHGLIKKSQSVKVLGDGPLGKKLTVHAHRFSQSAKEKILAAGGQVIELAPPAAASTPEAKEQAAAPPVTEQAKSEEQPKQRVAAKKKSPKTEQ